MTMALGPEEQAALTRRMAERCVPMVPMPTGIEPRLTVLAGVRAILFDVYGTLFICGTGDLGLNPEAARGSAMAEALRAADISTTNGEGEKAVARLMDLLREDHARRRQADAEYPEVEIRDLWRTLLREMQGIPPDDPVVARVAIEYEMRVNPLGLMPGFAETLAGLKERGQTLGIVSNAQFYTRLMFEALTGRPPVDWGFEPDLCFWSFEVGEAKPAPSFFQKALDRLQSHYGISPPETLMVGNDAVNDILPVARFGCRTALFAGDRRSFRPPPKDGNGPPISPDVILTSLTQLLLVCPRRPNTPATPGQFHAP